MISGSCLKSLIDLLNAFSFACSCFGRNLSGVIVIEIVEAGERRRMIWERERLGQYKFERNQGGYRVKYLSGETRAEVFFARKRNLSNCLQNGTLA